MFVVEYDPVWAMQQLDLQDAPVPAPYASHPGRYDDGSSITGGQSQHSMTGVNLIRNQSPMGAAWFDSDV